MSGEAMLTARCVESAVPVGKNVASTYAMLEGDGSAP